MTVDGQLVSPRRALRAELIVSFCQHPLFA